jgi:hypothetical protein
VVLTAGWGMVPDLNGPQTHSVLRDLVCLLLSWILSHSTHNPLLPGHGHRFPPTHSPPSPGNSSSATYPTADTHTHFRITHQLLVDFLPLSCLQTHFSHRLWMWATLSLQLKVHLRMFSNENPQGLIFSPESLVSADLLNGEDLPQGRSLKTWLSFPNQVILKASMRQWPGSRDGSPAPSACLLLRVLSLILSPLWEFSACNECSAEYLLNEWVWVIKSWFMAQPHWPICASTWGNFLISILSFICVACIQRNHTWVSSGLCSGNASELPLYLLCQCDTLIWAPLGRNHLLQLLILGKYHCGLRTRDAQ